MNPDNCEMRSSWRTPPPPIGALGTPLPERKLRCTPAEWARRKKLRKQRKGR